MINFTTKPQRILNINNNTFSNSSHKLLSSALLTGNQNNKTKVNNNSISTTIRKRNMSENKIINKAFTTNTKRGNITSTALKQTTYSEQEYTISIIENYAREIGISAFNFRTMEFYITQFIDNEAYVNTLTMINYWRPLEIIMNQKSESSSLHLLLKNLFTNCYIGFQPRKAFNEDNGKVIYNKSTIKELSHDEMNMKYVCMASLSGLISYLETNPNYIISDTLVIHYHYLENHLNISFNSTIDLELLINKKHNKTYGSLYSLFHCRTISGCRLLRSNILQPLAIQKTIEKRYNAITELINNKEVFDFIKSGVYFYKELEIYISKLMFKSDDPTENVLKSILYAVQGIRNCIRMLPRFNDSIKLLQNELFVNISNFFSEKVFDEIMEAIDLVIEDYDYGTHNAITRKQDTIFFLIKEGVDNVLDISRKTYLDTINEIYTEYENLKSQMNDPNMKLCYSEHMGYYVSISEKYFHKEHFVIYKRIYGKKYACSNMTLSSFSERIKEIKTELTHLSISNISNLIAFLKKKCNYLYVLSSHIASIDMLCAFVDYSISGIQTVRPLIYAASPNGSFIYGKNCRHPILEKHLLSSTTNTFNIIPNDYYLINHFNLLLLKGPNASGKTTYMKQIALIIILAQIGCFVPCDFFMFSLRNFIYTRFDTNDSIIENKGAFVKQIIDIQKVILNKTNNSLILLDEPFENTSSYDVLSIAISFLDMLTMLFNDSFIIISSHNKILTQLSEFYLNAITGSMVVEFKENGIDFLFKFKYVCGNNSNHNEKDEMEKNYGVVLAEMIGYNKEMIEFCKGIGEDICGKEGKVEDCIVLSKEGNVLKVFLMKMFMDVFDIMFCKRNYVLEEELNSKICKLFIFVNSCLKN